MSEKKADTRRVFEVQKVIDSNHLRKFLNLRQRAFRACRAYGTKLEEFFFKGGWVVHEGAAPKLHAELNVIATAWAEYASNEVYPKYEGWVMDFANKHPAESGRIIALAPTLDWVKRHNFFRWGSLKLSEQAIQAGAGGLAGVTSALAEQALQEIAAELLEAKIANSTRHTQSTRLLLGRVRDKANALAALHPRLQEIADTIGRLLPALPISGYIDGFEALAIKQVAEEIIDIDSFVENGFAVGAGMVFPAQPSLLAPVAAGVPAVAAVAAATAAAVQTLTQTQAQPEAEAEEAEQDWTW